jgi:hypothetical protein
VEVLRRHWTEIHTVEIHHRTSPNGTWLAVPAGQVVLPELVDDDEDDDDDDDDEEDDGPPTREGPEAAADTAGIMFRRAWEHFKILDRRRAWYRLTAYQLAEGVLTELEHTTVGGAFKEDGSVDVEAWDDATDAERERSIQDWCIGQMKAMGKMVLDVMTQHVKYAESVSSTLSDALKAQAEVATKRLEFREAELEAEVSKDRTAATADTLRDYGERFAPAVNLAASGYHAAQTRAAASDLPPHPSPVVESARVLLAQLDGVVMSYLIPVLGAELSADVLTVLRGANAAEPDPAALAEGWRAVAPEILSHQAKLVQSLPPELAPRLVPALQAFHLACMGA